MEYFLAWNRGRFRYPEAVLSDELLLRTAKHLSFHQLPQSNGHAWSQFVMSSGEIPEIVMRIDGSLLLLLLATLRAKTAADLSDLVVSASGESITIDEAHGLVSELFEGGVLLEASSDPRAIRI